MLNKKSVFNMVYAVALVSAITSCFGFLNELLNIAQLYKINILNTVYMKGDAYKEPMFFYSAAFAISAIAVAFLLLQLVWGNKRYGDVIKIVCNVMLVVACALMIALSFGYVFSARYVGVSKEHYNIKYFDYMVYYTIRSGVMSFVASIAVILGCNLIDARSKKAKTTTQVEKAE